MPQIFQVNSILLLLVILVAVFAQQVMLTSCT